jgi:hypothetical protein
MLKKFDDKLRHCKCMPQCSTGLGLEDEEPVFRKQRTKATVNQVTPKSKRVNLSSVNTVTPLDQTSSLTPGNVLLEIESAAGRCLCIVVAFAPLAQPSHYIGRLRLRLHLGELL